MLDVVAILVRTPPLFFVGICVCMTERRLYICASVYVPACSAAISLGQVPAWVCEGLSLSVVAACVIIVLIISCLLSIIYLPRGGHRAGAAKGWHWASHPL